MKINNGKKFQVPILLPVMLLGLSIFSFSAGTGAEQKSNQRFYAGLAAGYFYAQDGNFRTIYGQAFWPVELQLDLTLNRKISVFGSARYLAASGNTVVLDPPQFEESYAVRWRMTTWRLGVNYQLSRSRFNPYIGCGGSYSFYREQWPDAGITSDGRKGGFFIQAGGRCRLYRRLHARVNLEYAFIPAGSGAQGKVNLGGLSLYLGLLAGIF
jgi:hypothetical protein